MQIELFVCDNTPPAEPHYLNLLNHSWPSDRLVVSLISDQRYFTFLYRHAKYNIHNREKRNKQTRTWISSKGKKGEVCNTFLAFCGLLHACIRAKFLQSHQECWLILSRWPTQPLSPQALAPALFCRLPCSVHFSPLPPLFCSGTFLPSPSSGLVRNLARKPFV